MSSEAKTRKFDFSRLYKETRSELKKVSWPSRKELIQHTEVVFVSIAIIGAALWVVDFIFGKILNIFL